MRTGQLVALRTCARDDGDRAHEEEPAEAWRPKVRSDCEQVPRPCPFVSCRYHLYLESAPRGQLPDIEPHELRESCALDVADRGGMNLQEIGALFGVSRERIRQLEQSGFQKVRLAMYRQGWRRSDAEGDEVLEAEPAELSPGELEDAVFEQIGGFDPFGRGRD